MSSRAHGTPLRGTSHRKYSTPSVNRTPGASTINMGNDWMTAYRNSHCPDRISHMSSIFEPVACLNSNWRKASKNGVCCSASALCDCFSSFATSSLCSFFPRAFASFFASPVFAFCEMGYSGRSKGIGGATGGVLRSYSLKTFLSARATIDSISVPSSSAIKPSAVRFVKFFLSTRRSYKLDMSW